MPALPPRIPPLLAIPAVAAQLGVCSKTVRRWIARGELHIHALGRSVRVSQDDLDAFLAKHRR